MSDRIIYTPDSAQDIAESYDWYEGHEPGLGEQFLLSVEACASRIQRNPAAYPPVADGFRKAALKRFPFEIFYEATPDHITIYAVYHFSRDPKKWRARLKKRK
ncbi:type II toxin-antitoxin system RelE/ParE family toxin [Luteolibacter flavescens]|uniref:Type II toxin-antitoxin system RelE/ParE family toxin n=1 Tax=Luteolibacter flavescens TaxID=1859460 RepID=A0ABT3FUR9_9BACT|nr:type II toxin-antitoxin system RelE/ParE family toxin [Luteolibacter flavescens]MCW1887039.1 type II toxin-antitoxin system RelE/ParE family toxin [Luteolibacter flavescens]